MALAAALLAAGGAAEAVAQEIPGAVEPGQIEDRFDTRPRQREEVGPEIEAPAVPPEAVPREERPFTLTAVAIEGATVYPDSEFVPLYEDRLTRETTLADMRAVAKKITDRYHDDGYALSKAEVPPQEVTGGIVRIRVIEGFVGQVSIEGQVEGSETLLESYAGKITEERPLTVSTLERYVFLVEDLPGVSVRPLLEPVDPAAGEYRLVLSLTHRTVEGFAQVDNRGSKFVGPIQLWAGTALNSVFGLYEATRARVVTTPETEELVFVDFSHAQPVGTEGTTVTVNASYSTSEPGFTLEPLRIESQSSRLELQVRHPVIRSRSFDLYATGRFTYRDSETDQLDTEAFNDQLRVLRAGSIVSFDDGLDGRNWLSVEVSQGLDVLGASEAGSPALSRPGASAEFTKATFDFSRYQRVAENWGVLFLAGGQKASGTVLSAEEIGIGGERFGRAYDPAEITGPDGAATRIEIQRDGQLQDSLVRQYQLYAFYDFGAVWTEGPEGRQSLASTGFGVRTQLRHGIFGYVEFAQPLTRPVLARSGDRKDPRVFFVLRASLN